MSDPAFIPSLSLQLGNTLGAITICARAPFLVRYWRVLTHWTAEILAAVLYGIASVQVYIYFHRSPHDTLFLKRTILFLWILDTVYLALISHTIYYYAVTNFMNPLALEFCPWSLAADLPVGELIEVTVTSVFAYKIYKLSGNIRPLMFIAPPQLLSFFSACALSAILFKFPNYQEFNQRFDWIWYTVFGLQAFTDCAIAVALCVLLIRQRTGFRRTNSLIRLLVIYSINTCALTSSVSFATVITQAAAPKDFITLACAMVLPLLMTNSLLALLNSRDMLRDMHAGQVLSVHLSNLRGASHRLDHSDDAQVAHISREYTKNQGVLDVSARIPDASFDVESQFSRGAAANPAQELIS
ncbi:uncharacterized protein PHACADRAFT_259290 [Phanerochaete carnosa HHB-10118-sp]|uniref:DUF6534 domain-containing protein n=1 Tax=Phanerochaete carnosa (strain HHB-10118-sp) TaxID=650164 RepID=K5WRU7_PHACS|nr:uncharacterized protein PHACADRAFT_259290 [Phanerochaete carnosa HHB-10118-sp]EKM53117.1 hypothetical protein PHACADRAFT_259290 [Phanerochaete carnosa HHB-10118-sp]